MKNSPLGYLLMAGMLASLYPKTSVLVLLVLTSVLTASLT